MKKRFILLIILLFSIVSFTNPFTLLESSAAPSIAFFEDFEGSLTFWNATGFWHREDNTSSLYPSYGIPSPTHYMWYGQNTTGDYNNSNINYGSLTSAPIDLSDYSGNINLSFSCWSDTEFSDYQNGIYDWRLVFISPDGGSTWNIIANMSDNPTWTPYYFDISPYGGYSDVRIQFYFDTRDTAGNNYRGWLIDNVEIEGDYNPPSEDFNLWIEQENYAKVGETKNMSFYIDSSFSIGKSVNITVLLDTPTQVNMTFYQSWFVYISPYGSWNTTLDIYFDKAGDYDVWFIVTDSTGGEWSEWCWWEVTDDGYFELWIEQESTAFVGQEKRMDFYLDSYFSSGKWVNITIVITPSIGFNETLFEKPYIFIGAYETWKISLSYKFPTSGTYYVNFIVFDEYGSKWDVYCPWFVDAEGFTLWIDHDYISFIGKEEKMSFHADAFYDRSFEAYVDIFIQTPKNDNITLFNDYVYFNPYDYWETKYTFGFNETGVYTVYFVVVDDYGVEWVGMCNWEVLAEGLDLTIIQESIALPGEEKWMTFVIDSYYDYPVMFNATVEIYGSDGPVIIEELTYEYIEAHSHWEISLPYTFEELGHYDVCFMVGDDTGRYWDAWCCWNVQKQEEFLDLWINQEYYANPGDQVWMDFFIESYFNHSMYVQAEIVIEGPNDFKDIIFSDEIFLESNSGWAYKLSDYVFEEIGRYEVHLVVIDDIGKDWYADCWWEIGEVVPTGPWIDLNAPSSVDVNEEFDVIAKIHAGSNQSLIIQEVKIQLENDTIIHQESLNFSISAGYTETYSTSLQISTEGEYVIYVLVDTSEGPLEAKFLVKVGIKDDTTDDKDTEPRIESTPGFEGIFILSALVLIPLLFKRRKR